MKWNKMKLSEIKPNKMQQMGKKLYKMKTTYTK